MWRSLQLVLCFVTSNVVYSDDSSYVMTSQGPVRGQKESDGVYAFYNIPYATAPTGEDKFKAPLAPPEWIEPFEAVDKGVICPQAEFGYNKVIKRKNMQANCLIANVYVPDTSKTNLSVVLYIHGGGFQVGFGDRRKAKELMKTKRIIVVTFNYRLGIVGFLCLGTKDIPGNAGMKDIIAMLHWLNKNIASFGGNPDDITVSGYSTGAAAADLLILSKSANGLFHRVIIESGAGIAPYAVQSDPIENTKKHAKTLNFTELNNIYALEKFYKTLLYDVLTADAFLLRKDSSFIFVPCVENNVRRDTFLHDSPTNILKSGNYAKVPMLYGFTSMEGLMRVPLFNSWASAMNENFSDFLPPDLIFNNDNQKQEVARQIKEFYFGEKSIDTNTIIGYINFFTDVMFASPALRSVSLNVASGNNEVYLYYYSFVDENEPYIPYTKVRGANHCAQTISIFDDLEPKNYSDEYKNMREIMREMWHNFITTGNPVPEDSSLPLSWPPTNAFSNPYIILGHSVEVSGRFLEEQGHFWDEIYEKYYREPVPPPNTPPAISSYRIKSFYKQTGSKRGKSAPFSLPSEI